MLMFSLISLIMDYVVCHITGNRSLALQILNEFILLRKIYWTLNLPVRRETLHPYKFN